MPLALYISEDLISLVGEYGDIVTLGTKDSPARDIRTGIPIPPDQEFILTKP